MGRDDDDVDDVDASALPRPPQPWRRVVTDPATDRRRLSLYYYLVPEEWNAAACGGGLTFLGPDHQETTIAAQRDRLVIFLSNTTTFRTEPWIGSREMPHGSCIEMHLVQ